MKSLRNILLTALVLLATYAPALAQNVSVIGPVTPGHCTSFFSQTQVQDSGAGCGGGGGGGVTSVGLALPASTFSVSGSPVTGGGTLAGSFINQPINLVFAGPATGVPAVPTWRSLVANDLAGALASPPPIGTTTPAAGAFTALSATGNLTVAGIIDSGISGLTQCLQANSIGVISGTGSACGSGSGAVNSVSNVDSTLTISPTTGAVVASLALAHANTWTAAQTFSSGISASAITDTGITGSTQCLQVNSSGVIGGTGSACGGAAVSSVSNADGTLTISPTTGAVVASIALGHANVWTGAQSFSNADLILLGATSGQTTLQATAAAGATVATFPANTGTVAETNLAQTFSANQTFSATVIYSGAAGGSQVACLGLDASNNVVKNAAACGSAAGGGTTPTTQKFLSGSGTYNRPAGVLWILVQLQGAGGGGAGSGSTSTGNGTGGNGGATCWNTSGAACTSPVYQAGGGIGAVNDASLGGAGGTVSGSGTCSKATPGSSGTAAAFATADSTGGVGGNSANGGGGGGASGAAGSDAATNSGGGGGGAGSPTNGFPGGGGGAGANCIVVIPAPAATYTYAVGAGGTAGTAGTSGTAGGNGSAGGIWVVEYYPAAGTPGGSNTQLQYNNSGVLGGVVGATSNGTIVTFASNDLALAGATSGTTLLNATAVAGVTTATFPANTGTVAETNLAQTWTAIQTFNNSSIVLLGSSTGTTTFTSANAGASNFTATVPANNGTIAELNLAQTWSAQQTFSSTLVFSGLSAGTQTKCLGLDASNNVVYNAAACGSGGGGTPGGSNTQLQYNNSSAFGGIAGATTNGTVVTFASSDLALAGATSGTTLLNANATAGSTTATLPANTGIIAELNLAQTFSAQQTFSSTLVFSGVGAGTQTKCLGLDASNNVVTNAAACGGGGGTPGGSTGQIQYNNASAFGGVPSYTNASSIFALGNTSTAQQLIVYNTVDTISGPTNYERAIFDWTTTSNVLTIGTQAGGTGSNRGVNFTTGGVSGTVTFTSGLGGVAGIGRDIGTGLVGILVTSTNGGIGWAVGSSITPGSMANSDVQIDRVANSVIEIGNGGPTSHAGWLNWGGEARVTSDFLVTTSTVLTNVTGLSVNVQAGRTYWFESELYVTDAAAAGVQAAIAGTATATAIQYTGYTIADNAIKAKTNATALATAVGSTVTTETTGIIVRITGIITVNAAGTLTVQMAQNTSSGTSTIAKRGSYLIVHDMP